MSQDMKPTDILASFLAKICECVGEGNLGGVSRAVVFLRSDDGEEAIVFTYPVQDDQATRADLQAAIRWLEATPGTEFKDVLGWMQ